MRFNVISLAFALAAPAMAVQVGFAPGQNVNGPVQEFDEPSPAPAVTPAPVVTPSPQVTPVAASTPAGSVPSANVQVHVSSKSSAGNTAKVATEKSTPTTKAPAQSPTTAAKAPATPTSGSGSTGGTSGSGGVAPKGGQLLYIVNKYGAELDIITQGGGGKATGGSPSIGNGATATITLQSGWAGNFVLNPTGVPKGNTEGTLIEGSVAGQGFWDISFVDGYTVPVTCTCESDSTPFIGCNIDLFKQSAKCPSPSGNALCLNPARGLNNGPADNWFKPCQGAAYTYPADDAATQSCSGSSLTCCVGSSCAAGKNQHKRSINPVLARWAFPRNAFKEEN